MKTCTFAFYDTAMLGDPILQPGSQGDDDGSPLLGRQKPLTSLLSIVEREQVQRENQCT